MVKCKFGKNLKKFIATRSVKMFELQLVYETETLSTGFYSILTVKYDITQIFAMPHEQRAFHRYLTLRQQ